MKIAEVMGNIGLWMLIALFTAGAGRLLWSFGLFIIPELLCGNLGAWLLIYIVVAVICVFVGILNYEGH